MRSDDLNAPYPEAPPSRLALLRELRCAIEMPRMLAALAATRRDTSRGHRVVVVPGFGGSDRITAPLRRFLCARGYDAIGWGMGTNKAGLDLPHAIDKLSPGWPVEPLEEYRGEGSVPYLCDRFGEQVECLAADAPVTLVGWSLGGYLCREVARDRPERVRHVITLGSPITGGPKYTAVADTFRKRGADLDYIENIINRRETQGIGVPITSIFSRSDGIVDWRATIDRADNDVTHVEVRSTHLGMVFNPDVWREIHRAVERTL